MKYPNLKTAISAVPAVLLATPVLAQTLPVPDAYYGHMWGGGFGMGLVGIGMMLLFWGGIIFLAVLAVRWLSGRDSDAPRANSALKVLADRFARGEIDAEDFDLRRKALEA
jgi:putative membrane protein